MSRVLLQLEAMVYDPATTREERAEAYAAIAAVVEVRGHAREAAEIRRIAIAYRARHGLSSPSRRGLALVPQPRRAAEDERRDRIPTGLAG